jgi:hypothetical protein
MISKFGAAGILTALRAGAYRGDAKVGRARRPFSPPAPAAIPTSQDPYIMKASDPKATQELVGIVISGMPRPPQTTVFSAYVWGPAPTSPSDNEPKAN